MSNGWDFDAKKDSGGNKQNFTSFPEGITRIRVLDAAPFIRWVHWMPASTLNGISGKGRSVTCPGFGCPICEIRKAQKAAKEPYSFSMQQKMAINVFNIETNRREILEQGKTFFEDIRDLHRKLDIRMYDLKVRRRGTESDDTTYRIDPVTKRELDNGDEVPVEGPTTEAIEKAAKEVVDLAEYYKPHTVDQIRRLLAKEPWNDVMASQKDDEKEEVVIE